VAGAPRTAGGGGGVVVVVLSSTVVSLPQETARKREKRDGETTY